MTVLYCIKPKEHLVSFVEGGAFAGQHDILFAKTSAATNDGI